MQKDIVEFIIECSTWQQVKSIPKAPVKLLQAIEPPQQVWEDLSMDFGVHLLAFNNNIIIIVIVDRISKAGHFAVLPTHFSASKSMEVFSTTICNLHGYPQGIVSYRDTIFLSSF